MKNTKDLLLRSWHAVAIVLSPAILASCSHAPPNATLHGEHEGHAFVGNWTAGASYSSLGQTFGRHESVQCDEQQQSEPKPTLRLMIEQHVGALKIKSSVICHEKGKLLLKDEFPATEFSVVGRDLLLKGAKSGILTSQLLTATAGDRKISATAQESGHCINFTYELYGNPGRATFTAVVPMDSNSEYACQQPYSYPVAQ